jgi:hypothetical protein
VAVARRFRAEVIEELRLGAAHDRVELHEVARGRLRHAGTAVSPTSLSERSDLLR